MNAIRVVPDTHVNSPRSGQGRGRLVAIAVWAVALCIGVSPLAAQTTNSAGLTRPTTASARNLVLKEDPNAVSKGGTVTDPNQTPVSDPNQTRVNDPNQVVSDPNQVPVIDPNQMPVIDPNQMLVSDPNKAPAVDPNKVPSNEPNKAPDNEPTQDCSTSRAIS
jgi:hypothetical protein